MWSHLREENMAIAEYRALSYIGTAQGELKQDGNGYYRCIVGAFDVKSRNGQFYPLTATVKSIFEDSSAFMRNVHEGNCRGELDHPVIFGLGIMEIMDRLARMDSTRICVHYKHFELEVGKDEYGKPIILVYAWLRPEPPYGNVIQHRLDNRDEDCNFSVRSYTMESVQRGVKTKEITAIVTYDAVNNSGVEGTSKWGTEVKNGSSVGLEDVKDTTIIFTDADLNKAIAYHSGQRNAGLESDLSRLVHVRDALGWTKVQVVNPTLLGWDSRLR
jgi:hypothetical protein